MQGREFRVVLFGERENRETKDILNYLEDRGIVHTFHPITNSEAFLRTRPKANTLPFADVHVSSANPKCYSKTPNISSDIIDSIDGLYETYVAENQKSLHGQARQQI